LKKLGKMWQWQEDTGINCISGSILLLESAGSWYGLLDSLLAPSPLKSTMLFLGFQQPLVVWIAHTAKSGSHHSANLGDTSLNFLWMAWIIQ